MRHIQANSRYSQAKKQAGNCKQTTVKTILLGDFFFFLEFIVIIIIIIINNNSRIKVFINNNLT